MNEKEKNLYIKKWVDYIHELHRLTSTPNQHLSKKIRETINELCELVHKVADDKIAYIQYLELEKKKGFR